MYTQTRKFYLLALLGLFFTLQACNEDDGPNDPGAGDEELITTVIVSMVADQPTPDGRTYTWSWTDLDGPGGDEPVVVSDSLPWQGLYNYTVIFRNETAVPPANLVNTEIEQEGTDHQVFLQFEGVNLQYQYEDEDANGQPIGLRGKVLTFLPGEGTMTVTLRHEPDKDAVGVVGGVIVEAGGETDVEVEIPIAVFEQ